MSGAHPLGLDHEPADLDRVTIFARCADSHLTRPRYCAMSTTAPTTWSSSPIPNPRFDPMRERCRARIQKERVS